MKVSHCVLLVVLLLMPSGCESIRSISTITTSALTEHDLPGRHGKGPLSGEEDVI